MSNYLVEVNSKLAQLQKIDGQIIITNSPLFDLRKMFPLYTIKKGTAYNWNLALYSKNTYTGKRIHLYYVIKNID
jgi:hypothetical protein